MADLDNTTKLKLESILGMGGGYVLDLTNATFGDFVRTSIGVDPYERYGADLSKARLLRAVWENEPIEVVAKLNLDLLEHWRVSKQLSGETAEPEHESLRHELVARFEAASLNTSTLGSSTSAPVAFTTEATVSANKIAVEIHEYIYAHISQYLANGDYFHAVEESYKLVREKLRRSLAVRRRPTSSTTVPQTRGTTRSSSARRRLRAQPKRTSSEGLDTSTWASSTSGTRRPTLRQRRLTPIWRSTT